jgi:hypothetical protein
MIYDRFYNQVLTEIEAGHVQDGIHLLVGMLDAVNVRAEALAEARDALRAHDLSRMLAQDPLFGNADLRQDHLSDRLTLLAGKAPDAEISSTGRRLFEASSALTVSRALRLRQLRFDQKLNRAWQKGQNIGLITSIAGDALTPLAGTESANVSIIASDKALQHLSEATAEPKRFDLILAPDLADQHDAASLTGLLTLMRRCLADHGSIVLAALVPGHLGAGWCAACLNWQPQCHDDVALRQLAEAAGLTAQIYHDETGCIVWGEMRIAPDEVL